MRGCVDRSKCKSKKYMKFVKFSWQGDTRFHLLMQSTYQCNALVI